jgi:Protein of unknown function (DUF3311)
MRPLASLLVLATGALFALHQDFWFWRDVEPLAFGFLPPALWYHGLYCLAAALLMWTLTRTAWPHHLEHDERGGEDRRR